MKILHIELTEFETLEELRTTFYNIDKEMGKNGCQLTSSKKKAEKKLKDQYEKFGTLGNRIFWYQKCIFKGNETFVINETLFD